MSHQKIVSRLLCITINVPTVLGELNIGPAYNAARQCFLDGRLL